MCCSGPTSRTGALHTQHLSGRGHLAAAHSSFSSMPFAFISPPTQPPQHGFSLTKHPEPPRVSAQPTCSSPPQPPLSCQPQGSRTPLTPSHLPRLPLPPAHHPLTPPPQEHRSDPRRSKLKRMVPTVGSFFTPLRLSRAFKEYDASFHISRRKFIPPNFAELRHILNIAQVGGQAVGVLWACCCAVMYRPPPHTLAQFYPPVSCSQACCRAASALCYHVPPSPTECVHSSPALPGRCGRHRQHRCHALLQLNRSFWTNQIEQDKLKKCFIVCALVVYLSWAWGWGVGAGVFANIHSKCISDSQHRKSRQANRRAEQRSCMCVYSHDNLPQRASSKAHLTDGPTGSW